MRQNRADQERHFHKQPPKALREEAVGDYRIKSQPCVHIGITWGFVETYCWAPNLRVSDSVGPKCVGP